MKKSTSILPLALSLLLTLPSMAQVAPPGSPQPPPPPPVVVATFLGFSETQATQFRELLETLHDTMQSLQQQTGAKHKQMEDLLRATPPDAAAIGKLFLEIRALQQQGHQAVENYHQGFLGLLTEEQKQKVQKVAQARELLPVVGAFVGAQLLPPPEPPQPPPPR